MPLPFKFDFKNPDYKMVWEWRIDRLNRIRKNSSCLDGLKKFYADNPAQYIIDWGVTSDPRNSERGLPVITPFLLFEKQEELVHWIIERWKSQEPGLCDKSRDGGVSWITICLACTLCMFNERMQIGFGSRKEIYVDKKGDPNSIFWKARQFVSLSPKEFRGEWSEKKNAPFMRIEFPDKNSVITGEAGDGIGRGGRTGIFILDEAAWVPRAELIDASLSANTNCRIDVSTPRGMNNSFARKRFGGKVSVFTLHWRDDPRKDEEWYRRICYNIDDPVVIAQEIDLNYSASITNILIPNEWIRASIDSHIKLNIKPTGIKKGGFDVADKGPDKNSVCCRHGILITSISEWSGSGSDIYASVEKVFNLCDEFSIEEVDYDADGLGADVRGDSRKINEIRSKKIHFGAFHGSGAIIDPEGNPYQLSDTKDMEAGRTNADFFSNFKAQSWWHLRLKFRTTYRAVTEGKEFNPEDIISISSTIPLSTRLISELSQPIYRINDNGKIVIEKTPDGCKSPNLADSVMIAFAPHEKKSVGFFDIDFDANQFC